MVFRKNNKLTNFNSMKYLLILLIITINVTSAQGLNFVCKVGEFTAATSFDFDLNGNIYVSDISENTITKLDSNGTEINKIGGFGWEESSFDEPVSIFSNTLSLYVADKNNSRIQRFDKDLNFISQFIGNDENSELEFAYPSCVEISNIGDLFILDSDNNRILKFDLSGNYILEIGSNDAGSYALTNPTYFTLDLNSNIFVLDDEQITIFDQYGNSQLQFEHNYNPRKIHMVNQSILFIENEKLILFNMKERETQSIFNTFPEKFEDEIVDAKILENNLFILTGKNIIKYQIIN